MLNKFPTYIQMISTIDKKKFGSYSAMLVPLLIDLCGYFVKMVVMV